MAAGLVSGLLTALDAAERDEAGRVSAGDALRLALLALGLAYVVGAGWLMVHR